MKYVLTTNGNWGLFIQREARFSGLIAEEVCEGRSIEYVRVKQIGTACRAASWSTACHSQYCA